MKLIPLTQGKFAMVDDEDYDSLIQLSWHARKPPKSNSFYARSSVWNKETKRQSTVFMHRFIMNAKKGEDVDHVNRNGLDNRKINLRTCSRSNNCRNRSAFGKSKFLGVSYSKQKAEQNCKKRWQANICFNYKQRFLGSFLTEEEAAKAYDEAAKIHHGEFANLNFK